MTAPSRFYHLARELRPFALQDFFCLRAALHVALTPRIFRTFRSRSVLWNHLCRMSTSRNLPRKRGCHTSRSLKPPRFHCSPRGPITVTGMGCQWEEMLYIPE